MVDLYPIPIHIIPSERSTPQVVPLSVVQQWARSTGNPNAGRRDMAGITVPGIRLITDGFRYAHRFQDGGRQFRYREGSLEIQLWNTIYMSDRLSECERSIWIAHERDHVHDYEQLSRSLMTRLQGNPFLREFFLDQTWYSETREAVAVIMERFRSECGQIFSQLTADAARRRDTPAEYERVRTRIRDTCSGHQRRSTRGHQIRPTRRASERR